MLSFALSVTYLGAALCYVASPTSAACRQVIASRWARRGGWGLLGLGLLLSVLAGPAAEGLLVWFTMVMAAFSLLVIVAPLVDRFVPITSALALAIGPVAPWV